MGLFLLIAVREPSSVPKHKTINTKFCYFRRSVIDVVCLCTCAVPLKIQ